MTHILGLLKLLNGNKILEPCFLFLIENITDLFGC